MHVTYHLKLFSQHFAFMAFFLCVYSQTRIPRPGVRVVVVFAMIPDTKKIEPINIHKNPNNHLQRHSRCSTPTTRDAEKRADEEREPEKNHLLQEQGDHVKECARHVEKKRAAKSATATQSAAASTTRVADIGVRRSRIVVKS